MDKRLKKLIDKCEIVSFDIFDTLIKRDVMDPVDIYDIVQTVFEKKNNTKINDFAKKRYESEIDLWKNQNGIIGFDEIYDRLDGYAEKTKSELKEIELQIESESYRINFEAKEALDYSIENKKSIIVISDMYLPPEFLEQNLKRLYGNVFSKIYVSGSIGCSKAKRDIYEYVVKDLKTSAKRVLHIGDDYACDVLNARINGFHSFWMKKSQEKKSSYELKPKQLINSIISADSANSICNDSTEKYGYQLYGYLLLDFSHWLDRCVKSLDISEIYFLSREGLIFKKAYEKCFGNEKTHYLYLSRRSTSIPLIHLCKHPKDIFSVVKFRRVESLEGILNRIGVSYECVNIPMSKDTLIYRNELSTKYFDIVFENNWDVICDNSRKEYKILIDYLNQEIKTRRIAIVDIGWAGTMQKNLEKMLPECTIYGFYLGLESENEKMFSYDDNTLRLENLFAYRGIIESLFIGQHGSTIKYKISDARIEPVLADYESNSVLEKIQEGGLAYIDNYSSLLNYIMDEKKHPEIGESRLSELINSPTRKEVKFFGGLQFYDGNNRRLLSEKRLSFSEFVNSDWKIGYLKRIFHSDFFVSQFIRIMRIIK